MVSNKEILISAIVGVIGGALFVFAFPRGAISTLMHEVLRLPGPGAGIALVMGPWIAIFSLLSGELLQKPLTVFFTTLILGLTISIFTLIGVWSETKGKFGSPEFIAGLAVAGAIMASVSHAARRTSSLIKLTTAGVLGCAVLLAYFWMVIFPQTTRWVAKGDVPILLGLAVASGFIAGCLTLIIKGIIGDFVKTTSE